jgi:hypothetical protein
METGVHRGTVIWKPVILKIQPESGRAGQVSKLYQVSGAGGRKPAERQTRQRLELRFKIAPIQYFDLKGFQVREVRLRRQTIKEFFDLVSQLVEAALIFNDGAYCENVLPNWPCNSIPRLELRLTGRGAGWRAKIAFELVSDILPVPAGSDDTVGGDVFALNHGSLIVKGTDQINAAVLPCTGKSMQVRQGGRKQVINKCLECIAEIFLDEPGAECITDKTWYLHLCSLVADVTVFAE